MINHFRVDSKLIHGQITTRLLAFKHCNRILLIDDTVAGDESMRNIFSTVIPHSVKIHFRGMGDALNALERAGVCQPLFGHCPDAGNGAGTVTSGICVWLYAYLRSVDQ